MKKIVYFSIVLALLLISGLAPQDTFARRPIPDKTLVKRQLVQLINKTITSPDFALEQEEIDNAVSVIFTVTPDDRIRVESVKGPSDRLENYVVLKLSEITATNVTHSHNQKYGVTIRFSTN